MKKISLMMVVVLVLVSVMSVSSFAQSAPTITYPSYDYQNVYLSSALTATWTTVPLATYEVWLKDTTTGKLIASEVPTGFNTYYSMDRSTFISGHTYVMAVYAITPSATTYSIRYFKVIY